MIALFSTIFMESYAHFKVMLIALPWGNLLVWKGPLLFLWSLCSHRQNLISSNVAAFSFCSNFQPEFSKLSVDFMNLWHLTPSWPSEVGEPWQPDQASCLMLHNKVWKRTKKQAQTTKILCFVEQNTRGFDASLYAMNFLLPAHSIGEGGSLGIMFKGFACL